MGKILCEFWLFVGRASYIILYPFLAIYINLHPRTRVVLVSGDKILFVKGWLHNGEWDLPGGGLHKGENAFLGAIREVGEEVGIKLISNELEFIYKRRFRSGLKSFDMYYFYGRINKLPELKLQKLEIIAAEWINIADVSEIKIDKQLKEVIASQFPEAT